MRIGERQQKLATPSCISVTPKSLSNLVSDMTMITQRSRRANAESNLTHRHQLAGMPEVELIHGDVMFSRVGLNCAGQHQLQIFINKLSRSQERERRLHYAA